MSTPLNPAAKAAQDAARHRDGTFGEQFVPESGVELTVNDGPDYTTWTPVDIDSELARLHGEHNRHMARYNSSIKFVAGEVARRLGRGFSGKATRSEVETWVNKSAAASEAGEPVHPNDTGLLREYDRAMRNLADAQQVADDMTPLTDEFTRRGGWTRAFLVTNAGGHVHKDMDCHTCFAPGWDNSGNYRTGTEFYWVTDLSDHTEDEIVEKAGVRACTACYPSAPVDVLTRPTQIFSDDERAAELARAERAAAKAERDAKKVANAATPDGSELVVHTSRSRYPERFKTERSATMWAVDTMVDHRYGVFRDRDMDPTEVAAIDTVVGSLAAKHGKTPDEVRAEFEKKMVAKAKRDGYRV